MTGFFQDLQYAFRQLRKSPGYTLVAILSLALGIGANTAIFSLINGLLLKSLPVRDPQQLVSFGKENGGGQIDGIGPGPLDLFTYDFYQQLAKQPGAFQGISAYCSFPTMVSVRMGPAGNGAASQAASHLVSGNFFSVLGAEPILGRPLASSDEDAPGRNPVAVISYRYWQQVLSGDPSVVGRPITINGTLFSVIGVMPAKFFGVELNEESPDMWLPLTMQREVMLQPTLLEPHTLYWLHMMGRSAPGASLQQAQAWVSTQLQQFMVDREGSQISASRKQEVQRIYVELWSGSRGISHLRDQYATPLNILMGAVAMVLLIACANLANFLLARATSREREISTRLALGASRGRILRQILTEALLLSFSGGLLGLLLAFWATHALIRFVVGDATHTALAADPDWRVLAFTFLVAVLTGILFGIVPALRVSKISVTPALKANARAVVGAGGKSSRLLSKTLVTAQVIVSLVLLAGAGLLVRTLQNLQSQDFGFDRHNLLLVEFNAKFAGYKPEQLNGLYERMLARLNALPGVGSATLSGGPPMSGGRWNSPIFIQGHTAQPNEDLSTLLNRVGPRYFETTGIPLLSGRTISAGDAALSPKIVVVNQTLADHFFPHGDAIGHRFKVADPGVVGDWEIVGVVKDTKYNSPREEPQRMVYLPAMQLTGDDHYAYWLQVQTARDPLQVAGEVRGALADVDPNLPILNVRTIGNQIDRGMENERFISQLSTFFSLLALLLASFGLYGVMNYDVARRTNEIGLRMALGAQTGEVLWLVLKESLALLGIGVAIGIPAAVGVSRLLQSQLFELRSYDPGAFATAIFIVAVVTLLAAYIPARRAAQVDPMVALRYE